MTGLHCGTGYASVYDTGYEMVFPVFVTGLHCGHLLMTLLTFGMWVFPVFVTGLHCGS